MNNYGGQNLESKIITAVLVFMLAFTVFISGEKLNININYSDDSYMGQATLYYASKDKEFTEDKSLYTYVYDGKAVFDYSEKYDRIFIVANREQNTRVYLKSIGFTVNSVPVFTVSGNELNNMVYANKEENTAYFKDNMLVLDFTDENPYPRLVFSEELCERAKQIEEYSAVYCIIMAIVVTVAIVALLTFLEIFIDKRPKLKVYLKKNFVKIAYNTFVFILLFASLRVFNGYMLKVDYKTDLSGNDSTVYYDYDDDGFKEINSKYTKINSLIGENPFFTATNIEGLRIVPNRAVDKTAEISAVHLYHEGLPVKTYTARELKDRYLLDGAKLAEKDDRIVVDTSQKQESFPILSFNERFIKDINKSSWLVFFVDLLKTVGYLLVMQLCCVIYSKGKKDKLKYLSKVQGGALAFGFTILTVICAVLEIKVLAYIVMLPALFAGLYALGAYDRLNIKKIAIYAPLGAILSAVLMFNINSGLFAVQKYFAYALWCCALFGSSAVCYVYTLQRIKGEYSQNTTAHTEDIAGFLIKIFISIYIYEYIKIGIQMDYRSAAYISEMMLGDVVQLNIMLVFAAICAVYGLVGKTITNIIYFFTYAVILAGNVIKLIYHNTMLTPADFLQIKDAASIAPTILGKTVWHIFILFMLALVVFFVIKIKKIVRALKPKPFLWGFFLPAMLMLILGSAVVKDAYIDINVCDKPYIDEITAERTNGPAIYNIFKIMHIPDMAIKSPEDYNEQTVETLSAEFEKLGTKTDKVRPNVICILAESLMDLNSVEGLEINEDIIPYTREHGFKTMISPRYGGYTAAVEYEVLTGMTLAFYPPSVIPYTAYYNDENRVIPSVPQTFRDNGYKTYAIHPNTANFYGRSKAYKMMGFEEYWAIDKFNGAEQVKNKFVKDDAVADKIIETIENNANPVFTFGITMESHATSDVRFDETSIEVVGDISDDEISDVIQEAEAYRDTDRMIQKLCEYIDECEEPTMLYLFGDHLPPLAAFGNLSYINDVNNKYSTVALCHCNYKDIELTDRATPNFIAAQMVINSGVPHSSYFNFIYDLKDRMPMVHRDFTEINTEANEDLKKYYMIQYDLMFGQQWFYNKK